MFSWIKGLQICLFVVFIQCNLASTTESDAATNASEQILIKPANDLKDNWHSDTISRRYESPTLSTNFYLKQVLKQLTLLNQKFDRMMIRMIGSTVRDKENDDQNTRNIGSNTTLPNCESLMGTEHPSGIYHFDSSTCKDTEWIWNIYAIYCDQSAGGGWTVIQRRGGTSAGVVNFGKSWDDYAKGFGDLDGEFWLGNEWIHRLTTYHGPYELRVELEDFSGHFTWAHYDEFKVASKEENYRLTISGFTGNATDALSIRNSIAFSTFDRSDSGIARTIHSATIIGGWWYSRYGAFANLNGDWHAMDPFRKPFKGIIWNDDPVHENDINLKNTKMMIRMKNLPSV